VVPLELELEPVWPAEAVLPVSAVPAVQETVSALPVVLELVPVVGSVLSLELALPVSLAHSV